MEKFVELLKLDSAGRIFWLNLCAHMEEGCIDTTTVKQVLQNANENFNRNYSRKLPSEPGHAALVLVCAETSDNVVAIGSMRNIQTVDWGKIREVTTVLNEKSLWSHYVEATANGHQTLLNDLADKHGPLNDITESRLHSLLLERCKADGKHDLLKVFGHSLKKGKFLKTAVNRFWASIQNGARSDDPNVLIRQLGLTNFQVGQWVIEVAYDYGAIQEYVKDQENHSFKRPSALCVNDTSLPRFRALSPDEVGVRHKGEQLKWHGTTIDLNQWADYRSEPMNGLPEMMCVALPWGDTIPPKRIELVGSVENKVDQPNNKAYADYLEQIFSAALANEQEFLKMLVS